MSKDFGICFEKQSQPFFFYVSRDNWAHVCFPLPEFFSAEQLRGVSIPTIRFYASRHNWARFLSSTPGPVFVPPHFATPPSGLFLWTITVSSSPS
jgi:hypothetical protein